MVNNNNKLSQSVTEYTEEMLFLLQLFWELQLGGGFAEQGLDPSLQGFSVVADVGDKA